MMNNSENIKQMVEQLYSNREQTGDAVFMVESKRIHAHRNVLAALSPKYKAQFYGPNPDAGEIRIPNVSAVALNEFLQFFYKESVELTVNNIETVLDLAKQSLVDGFVEICVNFLKKSITTSNVCFVYRLAILYGIESLCLDSEEQISSKALDVFASEDFLQCDRNVLLHILNLDTFNCPEIDVLNACVAWARANCKQKGLDEKKPDNLRAALGDAIYLVRFASINPQEFATPLHGSLNGFFMPDELVELFSITSKVKDFRSQKFNQTSRIQSKDDLEGDSKVWSLECDRFVKRIIKDHADTNISCDSTIRCKKPIRLYGIAFDFHFSEAKFDFLKSNGINVFIEQDNQSLHPIKLKCKIHQGMIGTKIMFEKPIERMLNFEVFLGGMSFQTNGKLVLKDQVEVDNNKFECSGDVLTRFFFDNLQ